MQVNGEVQTQARLVNVLQQVLDQHKPHPDVNPVPSNADIDALLYEAYLKDSTGHALVALRYLTIASRLHAVPAIVRADLRRAAAGLRRMRGAL